MKNLRWSNVNLSKRIITVTMDKRGKGRPLDIDDTLLKVLKELLIIL